MPRLIITIVIIIVAAFILIPQALFTVDETQLAIVTRFGEFQRDYRSPGLYVKQPFVETVRKMDSRLLRVDAQPASLLTSDKRNLVIDAYARYPYRRSAQVLPAAPDRRGGRIPRLRHRQLSAPARGGSRHPVRGHLRDT